MKGVSASSLRRAADSAVAFFFIFAGMSKLIAGSDGGVQHLLFLTGVSDSSVLIAVASSLPYVEIALGAWVVSDWRRGASFLATALALLAFSMVLTLVALRVGWGMTCGCTPGIETTIGMAIARNGGLLALLLVPRALCHWRASGTPRVSLAV
ncbi:MAG: hypothetical protein CHACPFDD_03087 [Phycisphaerae bacterium]|nr:hypothetical protein [Phycisphaerae bacterium]